MKKIILSLCCILFVISIASCAKQETEVAELPAAQPKAEMPAAKELMFAKEISVERDSLVYLQVESVAVSSFDTTPDWAPPPDEKAIIDASLLSRWSSSYAEQQWVSLDFGQMKVLTKMTIFWEAAYAIDYDVFGSEDGQSWQLLLSLKDQDGGIDELEFAPTALRFVKIMGQKRFNPQWGISIWEVLCFGAPDENPQERPLACVFPQLASRLYGAEIEEMQLEFERPLASPGEASPDELQKGVVYTSWNNTELGSEASDQTLKYLKRLGISHLGIMIVWYQEDVDSTAISPDVKDTAEDGTLVHAINQAHSLGIKVMLKPHVDVKTGQWRGDIIPSQEWFANYQNYILHYARLAAQYNVELLSIGTELVNVTLPNWQEQWEELIKEIKSIYPGRLTYSANWDEYKEVGFWEKLDFVGIDAYFPLTEKNDPTSEELIAGWRRHAEEIEKWLQQRKLNKPVVFTEIGYCSADGTNAQPWAVLTNLSEGVIDQEEQAGSLAAMLTVNSGYEWFKGFYWWNFFPQKRWSPLGYTIRDKEAEQVLAEWLNRL